ncbi:MAG: hypothetical protein Q9227_004057 [Pyrenula ochraceoflavens]
MADAFPPNGNDGMLENIESRVLICVTGGTICMKKSTDGLIPARNFLETALAPRSEFNDGLQHSPLMVQTDDSGLPSSLKSLRTPVNSYGKQIRYAVLEYDELLDSSSIDAKGWTDIAK